MDTPNPPISNYPRTCDPNPQDRVNQLAAAYISIEQDHRARLTLTIAFYFAMGVIIVANVAGFKGVSILVPFILLFGSMMNFESTKSLAKLFEWDRYERTCFYMTQTLADLCFVRHRAMRPLMVKIREEIAVVSGEDVDMVLTRERQRLLNLPVIIP